MASHPDSHPDTDPAGADDSVEQVKKSDQERPSGVEDAPGDFSGTAGTGGENKVQDQSFER
jgi:hypothetical protein